MFAITTKAKIAAGIAAGALALGAAGAYAANANNAIPTYTLGTSGMLSHGGQTLNLVSTSQGATLTLPSTPFKNEGQCTSFFAKDKTLALAPSGTTTTVRKNYHGKLMSGLQKYCATYQTAKGTGDSADTSTSTTEQPEAADTETSEPTAAQSGASLGHGHGNHDSSDND